MNTSLKSNFNGIPQPYYFDFTGLENFAEYPMGINQLPEVNGGPDIGFYANPVTIAQYGLHHFNRFAAIAVVKDREILLRCADWLVENAAPIPNGGKGWFYPYPLKLYGTVPPWISAMAQGEAISLMLRAYSLNPDSRYLDTAAAAVLPFSRGVAQNGVLGHFLDGSCCYEEYPAQPEPHVLNGFIFALWGIQDYLLAFTDKTMTRLQRQALQGLRDNLQHYDSRGWSRYDLFPFHRLASWNYQRIHVRQLVAFAEMTGDNFYRQQALKWEQALKNPLARSRWIVRKIFEKIRLQFHAKSATI
ncbi:hypothetical protein KAH55_07975 [bacterium]|nr:hypothetical protein [bacterium]